MRSSEGWGAERSIGPIPRRPGREPVTSDAHHQEQLTQNGPAPVLAGVVSFAQGLRGVLVATSVACAPGSRGLHLAPKLAQGPAEAFLGGTEFAHLHPEFDGSLHLALPPSARRAVVETGWGRPGRDPAVVLLYAPRDEAELRVVRVFLTASYSYARNGSTEHDMAFSGHKRHSDYHAGPLRAARTAGFPTWTGRSAGVRRGTTTD